MPLIPPGCRIYTLRDTPDGLAAVWATGPGERLRLACAADVTGLLAIMRDVCRAEADQAEILIVGDGWMAALASAMRRLWSEVRWVR